jgi:hypothetical protein
MVAVPVPMESKALQSRAELSQLKEEHTVDLFHSTPAHAMAYGEHNDGGAPTASARARALSQDGGDDCRRRPGRWRVSDEGLRRRNYLFSRELESTGRRLTLETAKQPPPAGGVMLIKINNQRL